MDTSTGQIYLSDEAVKRALSAGADPTRIVAVHEELAGLLVNMSRSERREYYRRNRKRLNLPTWSEFNVRPS